MGAVEAKQAVLEDFGLQAQLLTFKDDVLGAFVSGAKTASSCEAALEGIKKLSRMQEVLSDEELVYVVHNINDLLQSDGDDADVASDDALGVLVSIADRNSKIVEEYTLPLLFSSLPDSPPAHDAHRERAKCWRILRWLARLCVSAPLFETLVVRLTTKLDIICAPKADFSGSVDNNSRIAYAHGILRTLASVLEVKVNASHADVPKYIDRLIPRLYNLFILLSIKDSSASSESFLRLLEVSGQIITMIVRTVPIERQRRLAEDLYAAYFDGKAHTLCGRHQNFADDATFKPFTAGSTMPQRNAVALLSSAVVAFRKDVLLPSLEPNEMLKSIQDWLLNDATTEFQRRAASYLLASLLNKNVEKLSPFISRQLEDVYKSEISSPAFPAERRRFAIQSWLWIARALVLLNHATVASFVDLLSRVFEDSEIGWDAARAVGQIASGGDDILTKSNHAVIKILYSQKYFKAVLPRILENLRASSKPHEQKANIVALAALISSLPKTVYVNEIPTFMPHLIRGLELPDCEIRTSIITTLTTVASSAAQGSTQEHATTLVSLVLKNALPQDISSTALRIAALKYLAVLPKIVRYDVLHPLKTSAIREMGKALDDPKRAVRKEAVDARAAWFSYKG